MKKILGCLSMAALAVVLAAPVSAQTLTLSASVPFDFVVGGRTMPAGDYVLGTVWRFRDFAGSERMPAGITPAFAMTNAADGPGMVAKRFSRSIVTGATTSSPRFGTDPRRQAARSRCPAPNGKKPRVRRSVSPRL